MALLPRPALELGAEAGVSFVGEGLDILEVYVHHPFSGGSRRLQRRFGPLRIDSFTLDRCSQ